MSTIPSLTTFTSGTLAKAAEVNTNFSTIRTTVNTYAAFVDTSATITGAWSFSTSPTFPAAVTMALGLTITAGGITVTAGGLTVTAGGLTVTAGASTFGAAVSITGTCTATTFSGSGASLTNLPATSLTGTIDNARLPSAISVTSVATSSTVTAVGYRATSGVSYGFRTTSTGSGGTIDATTTNHHRHTMTGNGTITISGLQDAQKLIVEVLQDATGSRTVAWSGVTSWAGSTTPTSTTTPSRKDVFVFVKCGGDVLGFVGGQNLTSTS